MWWWLLGRYGYALVLLWFFCEYSWEQIELCWVALRGYRGVNVSDNYLFIEAVLYRNGAISALFRWFLHVHVHVLSCGLLHEILRNACDADDWRSEVRKQIERIVLSLKCD